MYPAGHKFFTYAILSGHQHTGISRRYFSYCFLYALHALALTYHLITSGYTFT